MVVPPYSRRPLVRTSTAHNVRESRSKITKKKSFERELQKYLSLKPRVKNMRQGDNERETGTYLSHLKEEKICDFVVFENPAELYTKFSDGTLWMAEFSSYIVKTWVG